MKRFVPWIAITAAGALGYWGLHEHHELDRASQRAKSEEARLTKLESELGREKRRDSAEATNLQRQLAELKGRFEAEERTYAALEQRYNTARNRGLPGPEYTANIEDRLRAAKETLSDIQSQLRAARDQESNLAAQARIAQDRRRLNGRPTQADVDARLSEQQAILDAKQTRERLQGQEQQQKVEVADRQRELQEARKDEGGQKQDFKQLESQFQTERSKLLAIREQIIETQRKLKTLTEP